MATSSQGLSVAWGTATFQEVRSFAWDYGGNSIGSTSPEIGRAVVLCLGTANTAITNHGQRKPLVATGGGHNLTVDAIWDSVSATADVNDVSTFTVSFRLVKD